jgi:hypothetical protein
MRTVLIFALLVSLNSIHAQCPGTDFESMSAGSYNYTSAITGWSVYSRSSSNSICSASQWTASSPKFGIVATPYVANNATLANSPLGGTKVAMLNTYTGNYSSATRITQTLAVTASNAMYSVAIAGIFSWGAHNCCEEPGMIVMVRDINGAVDSCQMYQGGSYSCRDFTNAVQHNWGYFLDWRVRIFNLTAYINSTVTIEAYATDCMYFGHNGTMFFDAQCGPTTILSGGVSYCPTSATVAQIQAPPGMSSYSWSVPSSYTGAISQTTGQVINVPYPTIGQVFTVAIGYPSGCVSRLTYTIAGSTISGALTAAVPSCSLASTGSATLQVLGASNYSYTWVNSTGSVVGSASVASSLAPGNYTVTASFPSCGTATTTVTVGAVAPVNYSIQPSQSFTVCGAGTFIMSMMPAPGSSGNAYLWTLPSGQATTAAVSIPYSALPNTSSQQTYTAMLTPTAAYCPVVKVVTVTISQPSTPSITSGAFACFGTSSLQLGAGPAGGYFSASALVIDSVSGAINLPQPPGIYLVNYTTRLGGCALTASELFSIVALPVLSSTGASSLCAGESTTLTASGAATYTWTGQPAGQQTVAASPASTTVYTLTGANIQGCSATAFHTLTIHPLPTVNVAGPDSVCLPDMVNLVAGGAGGFVWTGGWNSPSLSVVPLAGTNTYSVTGTSAAGCTATAVHTVVAITNQVALNVTGRLLICAGEVVKLTGSGALYLNWNGNAGNIFTTTPTATDVYTLTGTNEGVCYASKAVMVSVNPCTGLPEQPNAWMHIYPSPVNDQFIIETIGAFDYSIVDVTCRTIDIGSSDTGRATIHALSWPAGVYLIRINGGDGPVSARIIKE